MNLQLISPDQASAGQDAKVLRLPNDVNPLESSLDGIERVELTFPKFSDGRAFSQAFMLRRRMGFAGDIRATGEVLVDQLVQMERTGFSSAVLRADQDPAVAKRQFARYAAFYQGDVVTAKPHFQRAAR